MTDHQARGDAEVEIQLLGEFAVRIDGRPQPLPPARPASLLKILALHDGRLTLEQAIDMLWPDTDAVTGRRRLRNVLRRIREALGELVVRRDSSLWLADHVRTDISKARSAARQARCPGATFVAVSEAVEQHRAALLPDDRYEPWAEDARRDRETHLLALLDRQARLAIEAAIQSLEEAQLADPFSTDRQRRLDRLRGTFVQH